VAAPRVLWAKSPSSSVISATVGALDSLSLVASVDQAASVQHLAIYELERFNRELKRLSSTPTASNPLDGTYFFDVPGTFTRGTIEITPGTYRAVELLPVQPAERTDS
jgi:hypothetical protein